MCTPQSTLKLARSASEQNTCFAYICLLKDIKPETIINQGHDEPSCRYTEAEAEEIDEEDEPIQVERSKALHELREAHSDNEVNDDREIKHGAITSEPANITEDKDDDNESQFLQYDNPNILKLTRMKWLSEGRNGGPDASSPSLSPTMTPSPSISTTSTVCSHESESEFGKQMSIGDKCLSTILRLDKEHNLFGMSNIAIVRARPSKKIRKEDERAVFHQTAIVQVCCSKGCCRHKSNTDLPSSLKCGGCGTCLRCFPPCGSCPTCLGISCSFVSPCPSRCSTCPKGSCGALCPPPRCTQECIKCYGFKMTVNKKPEYEPEPPTLTPRSSCVLLKPYAARPCSHCPPCLPPSSCFPYLMPCFWPARAGAPCSAPTRCFHNPPCPPRRKPRSRMPPEELCPTHGTCKEWAKDAKCANKLCLGNNPDFKKEFENKYSKPL